MAKSKKSYNVMRKNGVIIVSYKKDGRSYSAQAEPLYYTDEDGKVKKETPKYIERKLCGLLGIPYEG